MLILNKIRYKIFILAVISMLFVLTGCATNEEGLVAKVDGEGITEEEFNIDFNVFKNVYEQQLGEDALTQVEDGRTLEETLKESIIEKLIVERLVAKEAKAMNIEVNQDEINKQVEEYIELIGGEEKFQEFLENNGISKEYFQGNIRNETLLNEYMEAFLSGITISEKEEREYLEKNKDSLEIINASHILVKTEEEGKEVLKRLKSGEEFAKLAEELSADKASGAQGGNLGYFRRGSIIAEFEEAAFALNSGEISELVKTEVGYHIIFVEDKKDSYEDLKDAINARIKEDKYLEKIQELRSKAKVKIFIDIKSKS